MNEFVLIFRSDFQPEVKFSPEEMQTVLTQWQNWMGSIAAQDKLVNRGYRLGGNGKAVKPGNVITNGPYAEIREMISGLIVVKAASIEEAAEIAKGCPILLVGGNVEVRDIIPMNG